MAIMSQAVWWPSCLFNDVIDDPYIETKIARYFKQFPLPLPISYFGSHYISWQLSKHERLLCHNFIAFVVAISVNRNKAEDILWDYRP